MYNGFFFCNHLRRSWHAHCVWTRHLGRPWWWIWYDIGVFKYKLVVPGMQSGWFIFLTTLKSGSTWLRSRYAIQTIRCETYSTSIRRTWPSRWARSDNIMNWAWWKLSSPQCWRVTCHQCLVCLMKHSLERLEVGIGPCLQDGYHCSDCVMMQQEEGNIHWASSDIHVGFIMHRDGPRFFRQKQSASAGSKTNQQLSSEKRQSFWIRKRQC